MEFNRSTLPRLAGAAGLSFLLALGGSAAFADDNDPTAYLYEGSCDTIADAKVVDEIDDLDPRDADLVWTLIGNGQDQPSDLIGTKDDSDSRNDVQALVDGDYAIVVHQKESRSSAMLVCGDVDGEVKDGTILFELGQVEESGFEGRALIQPDHEDDDGDLELEFAIGVYPAGSVDPMVGSPPAT